MSLRVKRAYEEPTASDGVRVLVERLWPRGVSKEDAAIELWPKDVAPSTELRQWFAHDPAKWAEFRRRYQAELAAHPEVVAELRKLARRKTVTLIYAAKDEEHNSALVLKELLERSSKQKKAQAARATGRRAKV